jgi:hypothetical protein
MSDRKLHWDMFPTGVFLIAFPVVFRWFGGPRGHHHHRSRRFPSLIIAFGRDCYPAEEVKLRTVLEYLFDF